MLDRGLRPRFVRLPSGLGRRERCRGESTLLIILSWAQKIVFFRKRPLRRPEARLDRSTARPSSTRSVVAWVNFVPWPSWVTVRPRPEQTGCHRAHGANLVPVPALGEQMTADAREKSHSMFDIGERVYASEPSFMVVDTRSCFIW